MADASDPRRDALHKFLQEQGPPDPETHPSALLTGWVVVTSWVDGEGDRWLTKGFAAEMPHWAASGMHHEALYGHWPVPDEAE